MCTDLEKRKILIYIHSPGVWHHPMIALDNVTDFTCLVYEDGTSGDCEVVQLATTFRVVP